MKNIFSLHSALHLEQYRIFTMQATHFSLGKKSMYSGESLLSVLLCTSTSKSDVEWSVVDSMDKVLYTKCYDRFQEMVQFETHFSNVLDNTQ